MAQQIKNTFLKSKMNKDLDDRILPNGEYRDARNISVGKSEDDDVGAIENVIGNNLIAKTDVGNGLTVIGIKSNNSTNQIFVFLTDYTDPNPSAPTDAPSTSKHYIYAYDNTSGNYTLLVQGEFLNFSTTNRIIGINLIENLLFWTDNRNQPRKINIALFTSNTNGARSSSTSTQEYYTQEHQISVAKYSPYQAIQLYNKINLVVDTSATSYFQVAGNQVAAITPFIGATVVSAEQSSAITGLDHIKVTNVALQGSNTRITVSPSFGAALTTNTYVSLIMSTMTNKTDDSDWPGDPDYLEDRFVRFSYRFKYDDNEYSLMAPFTQIAYIPKQYGYFLNGDEDAAYQSTIVNFMENQVQNIGLVIPLPTNANRIVRDYKISEVEILFRESDSVAVKVLESVSAGEISGASGVDNYYTYDYQSRKPYKTLPEAQTVRVYDKVPVRAFSQESSGNRIIYGNYRDQHTPPSSINYNCRISKKSSTGKYNNWIEYPNHSVKRNRNYQVGFVLADKFGRQSPVILSSVDNGITSDGQFYSGSTIYSPYDIAATDTDVKNWFGDAIMVLVNSEVSSTRNLSEGTPGLYAIKQNAATSTAEGYATTSAVIVDNDTYTFKLDETNFANNNNIPRIGDYLRGAYEDFVKVTNIVETNPAQNLYEVTTTGRVNDVYLRVDNLPSNTADLKFAYTINDLGWYSYKIVVKQTEQDYYNVYLPGILNGYPGQSGAVNSSGSDTPGGIDNGLFPTDETNLTAFAVLFNDNINKIPRDLAEVGPDQKQYRSSVTLYGRVTNIMTVASGGNPSIPYNSQYYARINSEGKTAISHTSTAIARAKEVNMGYADLSNDFQPSPSNPKTITGGGKGDEVFYQIDTNPLITRISTVDKPIGATALNETSTSNDNVPTGTANMLPYLAIYETDPVESLLDIYWETASEGLIVDLNADVLSGSGGATSFKDVTWLFTEATTPASFVTTSFFKPVNIEGEVFTNPTTAELISQTNGNGDSVELFELFSGTGSNAGEYKIKYIGNNPMVFGADSRTLDVYTFIIRVTTSNGDVSDLTLAGQIEGFGALKNIAPEYNVISAFPTTKDTRVILPGISASGIWATANPRNGSGYTAQNRSQLEYTITGGTYPDNWEMEKDNGEITQAIAGDIIGGEIFEGNPNGTYTVDITVTDANGVTFPSTGSNDYKQRSFTRTITIIIGYAELNTELKATSCLFNPTSIATGTIGTAANQVKVSGIWYIAESNNASYLDFSSQFSDITTVNRLGTSGHKQGTIAFTYNVKQLGTASSSSSFKPGDMQVYYRIAGNTTWLLADRANEYNKSGITGGGVSAPFYNIPKYKEDYTIGLGSNPNTINWMSVIRAYDYLAFASANTTGASIEYALVVKNLEKNSGSTVSGQNDVIGWVQQDDLHYPKCVPWQGKNAAPAVTGTAFKYFRSAETNTFPNQATISTSNIVYAETPYGEYVGQFFTDSGLSNIYKPASQNNQYINFRLDRAGTPVTPSGLGPWSDLSGNTNDGLSFAAGFSYVDGKIITNTEAQLGVNATATSQILIDDDAPPNNVVKGYTGTTRLKQTN